MGKDRNYGPWTRCLIGGWLTGTLLYSLKRLVCKIPPKLPSRRKTFNHKATNQRKGEKGRTHLACKLAASLWYGSSFPYLLVTRAPSRSSIWHDEHQFLFREMTATVALIRRCKPNSTFVLGVVIVSIDCDGESFTRKYPSRAQKSFILRLQEIENKHSISWAKESLLTFSKSPLIWTYLTMYLVECLCCIRV